MSKKRNHINTQKALQIMREAYGLKVKEFNFYQFRIWHEEFQGFFDWYHTTGSLVLNTDGRNKGLEQIVDAEDVAMFISKYVVSNV